MPTKTQGFNDEYGPRQEDGSFYTATQYQIPHSGVHGFEAPHTEFDNTTLAEATQLPEFQSKAPNTTEGLPADLQNVGNRHRTRNILVTAGSGLAAVSLGALAFFGLNRDGDETVRTPEPSPSGQGNSLPTKPPITPTPETSGQLTTAQIAERLTPPSLLYDQKVIEGLEADQPAIQSLLSEFGQKYPSLETTFSTTVESQVMSFETLQSTQLIDAQRRFNDTLAATTFTDESLLAGNPIPITIGEFLSSKDAVSGLPFPAGVMSPSDIAGYESTSSGLSTENQTPSFIAGLIDRQARLTDALRQLRANENLIGTYNSGLSAEDVDKYLVMKSKPALDLYVAGSVNPGNPVSAMDTVAAITDPNGFEARCTQGYVLRSLNVTVPYGPSKIPVNGITVACDQPQAGANGEGQFVIATYVLLPVDKYQAGKKLEGVSLHPFRVAVDSFAGIRRS